MGQASKGDEGMIEIKFTTEASNNIMYLNLEPSEEIELQIDDIEHSSYICEGCGCIVWTDEIDTYTEDEI